MSASWYSWTERPARTGSWSADHAKSADELIATRRRQALVGIVTRAVRAVIARVPISTPFPDVAMHVVKSKGVGCI
jgi:hypothetical protein